MAKVSADKLLELLGRSQLVEKEQLDKQIAKLKEKCGGELPSDPEKLASALVEQDTITRWQS